MHVELFAPDLPEEMIRSIRVRPCGTKLEVLIAVPCWFFESVFMECRLGDNFRQQHAAVEAHMMHVVQPVRLAAPSTDNFICGSPYLIPLPEEFVDGQIQWTRGT